MALGGRWRTMLAKAIRERGGSPSSCAARYPQAEPDTTAGSLLPGNLPPLTIDAIAKLSNVGWQTAREREHTDVVSARFLNGIPVDKF
jgi:hypothetical protein